MVLLYCNISLVVFRSDAFWPSEALSALSQRLRGLFLVTFRPFRLRFSVGSPRGKGRGSAFEFSIVLFWLVPSALWGF